MHHYFCTTHEGLNDGPGGIWLAKDEAHSGYTRSEPPIMARTVGLEIESAHR